MLFFANKAKQEVNEIKEVKVIQIEALETVFNTETGEWETESMRQNDNLAKKLRIQIETEKVSENKLKNALALRNHNLIKIKKEIIMILNDHCEILEKQGFAANELLSKIQTE